MHIIYILLYILYNIF